MANLKEIRSRISSVSSTMKITSAMKMVSAAKLKKAQDKMTNIKPYSSGISTIINNLLPCVSKSDIQLKSHFSTNGKHLIIAVASNRGLCGGFNANVYKEAKKHTDNKSLEVFAIGKKAIEIFKRSKYNLVETNSDILDNPKIVESKKLSQNIISKFLSGDWERVSLILSHPRGTRGRRPERCPAKGIPWLRQSSPGPRTPPCPRRRGPACRPFSGPGPG